MKFLAQLCTVGFFPFDKDAMIFHLRADHDASLREFLVWAIAEFKQTLAQSLWLGMRVACRCAYVNQ